MSDFKFMEVPDTSGVNAAYRIEGEAHHVRTAVSPFLFLNYGYFYVGTFALKYTNGTEVPRDKWKFGDWIEQESMDCDDTVVGYIMFLDPDFDDDVIVDYNQLGGVQYMNSWVLNRFIQINGGNGEYDYNDVLGLPKGYVPKKHFVFLDDISDLDIIKLRLMEIVHSREGADIEEWKDYLYLLTHTVNTRGRVKLLNQDSKSFDQDDVFAAVLYDVRGAFTATLSVMFDNGEMEDFIVSGMVVKNGWRASNAEPIGRIEIPLLVDVKTVDGTTVEILLKNAPSYTGGFSVLVKDIAVFDHLDDNIDFVWMGYNPDRYATDVVWVPVKRMPEDNYVPETYRPDDILVPKNYKYVSFRNTSLEEGDTSAYPYRWLDKSLSVPTAIQDAAVTEQLGMSLLNGSTNWRFRNREWIQLTMSTVPFNWSGLFKSPYVAEFSAKNVSGTETYTVQIKQNREQDSNNAAVYSHLLVASKTVNNVTTVVETKKLDYRPFLVGIQPVPGKHLSVTVATLSAKGTYVESTIKSLGLVADDAPIYTSMLEMPGRGPVFKIAEVPEPMAAYKDYNLVSTTSKPVRLDQKLAAELTDLDLHQSDHKVLTGFHSPDRTITHRILTRISLRSGASGNYKMNKQFSDNVGAMFNIDFNLEPSAQSAMLHITSGDIVLVGLKFRTELVSGVEVHHVSPVQGNDTLAEVTIDPDYSKLWFALCDNKIHLCIESVDRSKRVVATYAVNVDRPDINIKVSHNGSFRLVPIDSQIIQVPDNNALIKNIMHVDDYLYVLNSGNPDIMDMFYNEIEYHDPDYVPLSRPLERLRFTESATGLRTMTKVMSGLYHGGGRTQYGSILNYSLDKDYYIPLKLNGVRDMPFVQGYGDGPSEGYAIMLALTNYYVGDGSFMLGLGIGTTKDVDGVITTTIEHTDEETGSTLTTPIKNFLVEDLAVIYRPGEPLELAMVGSNPSTGSVIKTVHHVPSAVIPSIPSVVLFINVNSVPSVTVEMGTGEVFDKLIPPMDPPNNVSQLLSHDTSRYLADIPYDEEFETRNENATFMRDNDLSLLGSLNYIKKLTSVNADRDHGYLNVRLTRSGALPLKLTYGDVTTSDGTVAAITLGLRPFRYENIDNGTLVISVKRAGTVHSVHLRYTDINGVITGTSSIIKATDVHVLFGDTIDVVARNEVNDVLVESSRMSLAATDDVHLRQVPYGPLDMAVESLSETNVIIMDELPADVKALGYLHIAQVSNFIYPVIQGNDEEAGKLWHETEKPDTNALKTFSVPGRVVRMNRRQIDGTIKLSPPVVRLPETSKLENVSYINTPRPLGSWWTAFTFLTDTTKSFATVGTKYATLKMLVTTDTADTVDTSFSIEIEPNVGVKLINDTDGTVLSTMPIDVVSKHSFRLYVAMDYENKKFHFALNTFIESPHDDTKVIETTIDELSIPIVTEAVVKGLDNFEFIDGLNSEDFIYEVIQGDRNVHGYKLAVEPKQPKLYMNIFSLDPMYFWNDALDVYPLGEATLILDTENTENSTSAATLSIGDSLSKQRNDRLIMINGIGQGFDREACNDVVEITKSAVNVLTDNSGLPGVTGAQAVFFNGKYWHLGGYKSTSPKYSGLLHNSEDLITWTPVPNTPWSGITLHQMIVFKNMLVVIGGSDDGVYSNRIAFSEDGESWTTAPTPPFEGMRDHKLAIMDDELWVIGGNNYTEFYPGIWGTKNLADWRRVSDKLPGSGNRTGFSVAVFGNKLWLASGGEVIGSVKDATMLDLYNTSDGENWELVYTPAEIPWISVKEFFLGVWNDKLTIMGGRHSAGVHGGLWQRDEEGVWVEYPLDDINKRRGAAWLVVRNS